ncbi:hypothetical protein Aduo_008064 [Ancylostoma duodenale]
MHGLTDNVVLLSVNVSSDHIGPFIALFVYDATEDLYDCTGGPMSINDELLVSNPRKRVDEMALTDDVRKNYPITNIVNISAERASFYEPLPPRVSQKTRQRGQLHYGTDTRSVEYAVLCKLIRRSYKEALYRRHNEFLQKAIRTRRAHLCPSFLAPNPQHLHLPSQLLYNPRPCK